MNKLTNSKLSLLPAQPPAMPAPVAVPLAEAAPPQAAVRPLGLARDRFDRTEAAGGAAPTESFDISEITGMVEQLQSSVETFEAAMEDIQAAMAKLKPPADEAAEAKTDEAKPEASITEKFEATMAKAMEAAAAEALQTAVADAQAAIAKLKPTPVEEAKPEEAKPEEAPKEEAAAPAPAAEPAPAPTHTVRSGDSLSAIAGQTLGDAGRWGEIFELNRDQLSDPNTIFAGQVLKLPSGATPAPAPAQLPAPTPGSGPNTNRDQIYMQQPNNWTCGPTSLTMAAAAFGVRGLGEGTVNELTDMTHTRPEYGVPDNTQLPNAARAMGLQAGDSRGSSPAAVREALQAGRGVILNGSLGEGGHFVYVAGLNPDGSFIVCDPWRPEITAWNDGELDHFAHNNPGHGNMVEVWR